MVHCNWKRWKNSTLGWNTAIIPPSRDQRWRRRWKALIFHHTWWNLKMHVATECGAKVALSILWDHHSAHNTLCMFSDHKCKIWTFLNLVNIYLGLRLYKLRKYKYHTKPTYVRHTIRTYLLTDEFHVNKKYVLSNSESVQCNFFSFFDYVTFIQFKICCCIQNFIKIGWFFAEMWRYNDFQNGGHSPSWNCFTTIRDHPRSLCCWPQLSVKFHVNLIHRFEDITIWIFRIFGLKCLFRPPKWGFRGTSDP